jgi:hypothetical protein
MRIRTIKPAFWSDEKTGTLSLPSALLFIAMLNFADDKGRLRGVPALLRAQAFPYRPEINIEAALNELLSVGLVQAYKAGGQSYLQIKNFLKHQKVSRPSEHNLMPEPEVLENIGENESFFDENKTLTEDSLRPHGGLMEDSMSTHGGLTAGREGKGEERNGKEKNTTADASLGGSEKPKKARNRQTSADGERIKSLTMALAASWQRLKGSRYAHLGAKDVQGLKRLIGSFSDSEIIACWEIGIQRSDFVSCADFGELAYKFNRFQSLKAETLKAEQKAQAEAEQERQFYEFQEWCIADKLVPANEEEAKKWDAYIEYYKTKQQAKFIRARELLWQPGGDDGLDFN